MNQNSDTESKYRIIVNSKDQFLKEIEKIKNDYKNKIVYLTNLLNQEYIKNKILISKIASGENDNSNCIERNKKNKKIIRQNKENITQQLYFFIFLLILIAILFIRIK